MTKDELIALGRRVKRTLKKAKRPMTLDEIASALGASRYDVHDALSNPLHGWVEMRNNTYKLL